MAPTNGTRWPLAAALVAGGAVVAAMLGASLRANQGHLVYALDDPYIHMALARNLAREGVWGVTRHEYTAASSSPLWTMVLALVDRVAGAHEVVPLVLNLLCGVLVLIVADRWFARYGLSPAARAAGLFAILFLTPLPTLAFVGMEHSLQVLLALLFAWQAAERVAQGPAAAPGGMRLAVLAALLAATRFEGAFAVLAAALLLAARRAWRVAALTALAGAAPIVLGAAVSIAHGWYALPTSVLLKGNLPAPNSLLGIAKALGGDALHRLQGTPLMFVLLLGALAVVLWQPAAPGERTRRRSAFAWIFALTALLHLQFADLGWLYRYEAYLVALACALAAIALPDVLAAIRERWPTRPPASVWAAGLLAALLLATPPVLRARHALLETVQATHNIYEQQYQAGRFLARFYPGAGVALNDVGATSYLGDFHLTDLAGLATLEVARARLGREFDTAAIRRITRARGVTIAIVFDFWFRAAGGMPREWIRVGRWIIGGNVASGGDTVSFYGVDGAAAATLERNLRAYSSELPPGVGEQGAYRDE